MISFRTLALGSWSLLAGTSFFVTPQQSEQFPSLCLTKFWWGVSCPGCGMGRSLLAAFQGQWAQSFEYHILGIPFLVVWTGYLLYKFLPLRRGNNFAASQT